MTPSTASWLVRFLILLAALLSSAPPLGAQSSRFVVDRWTTEQGLPQNTVNAIAQMRDGYLWLATFGGLVRFDGLKFTVFASAKHPGLASDRLLSLAVDSGGALWIGTESGLSRYAGGRFTEFGTREGLPDDAIQSLLTDAAGTLWVGTLHGGIARLERGRFARYTADSQVTHGSVRILRQDAAGTIWATVNERLCRRDAHAEHFACGANAVPGFPRAGGPIAGDASGAVWLANDAFPLRVIGAKAERFDTRHGYPAGAGVLLENAQSGLLISTRDGLSYLPAGSSSRAILLPDADGRAVRNEIFTVFRDRENVMWVGTRSDGLLRVRPRAFRVFTTADGLTTDNPTATLVDGQGRLWVAINCGGWLARFDSTRERFETFRDPGGARVGCAWSLALASDGSLWAGGYGPLIHIVRGRVRERLREGTVLALLVDRAGTLWAGTDGHGLLRIEQGAVTARYDTSAGLAHLAVRQLYEDRRGTLWIGTMGGLSRRAKGDQRFISYTTANGLPDNQVRAIHEDDDGTLWIGTYGGGLARLKNGTFTTINSAAGLAEDVVSSILEDEHGNFWMTGNRGVFRAKRQQLNAFADGRAPAVVSVSYGRADGLISAETNGGFQPASTRDARGRMWFPTIKGLAMLDPAAAVPETLPPGIAIEEVKADGVVRPAGVSPRFEHNVRNIEVTYAGISTASPEHTTYRYRLDGLDTGWVDVGTRRTAYFTGLRPGKYGFHVSAANRDGVWNETAASTEFTVLAPIWATWWFRTLLAIALAAAVAAAVRARFVMLHAAQRRQAEFARRFIEGQETERKRIAGELHDSVGQGLLVAKNRAALALKSKGDSQSHLAIIASVLTETLEDARRISHNLRPHELDRLGLGAAVRSAVQQASDSSGIRITAEADGVDDALTPEASISVYRVIQEGLSNLVKHSGATDARVRLRKDNGVVRLLIADNGRGFDPSTRTAFGLSGIEQRIRLLGGTAEILSSEGSGTTITVTLQAQTDAEGAST